MKRGQFIPASESRPVQLLAARADEGALSRINALQAKKGKPALDAADVWVVPIRLVGTMPTDQSTQFNTANLEEFAAQVNDTGKSLMIVHKEYSELPIGVIFNARVTLEANVAWLDTEAYLIDGEDSQELVALINGGVVNEASIGFVASEWICSITGEDYWQSPCMAGQTYAVTGPDGVERMQTCYLNFRGVTIKEGSLVSRGSHPATNVGAATQGLGSTLPAGRSRELEAGDAETPLAEVLNSQRFLYLSAIQKGFEAADKSVAPREGIRLIAQTPEVTPPAPPVTDGAAQYQLSGSTAQTAPGTTGGSTMKIGILLASGIALASALSLPNAEAMTEADTIKYLLDMKNERDRLMGLAGVTDSALLEPTIAGLKAKADQAVTLQAKITEITTAAEAKERAGIIEVLLSSHAITPALTEWAQAAPMETLREFALKSAPMGAPVVEAPKGESAKAGRNVSMTLSADEMKVITQLNITKEAYLASRESARLGFEVVIPASGQAPVTN